jgi:hypothetical protein
MRFRLEQEVPEQLWKAIEYQPFYQTYEHYIGRSQRSTKVASGGERGVGLRQKQRPRRQAAQAVKSYTVSLGTLESSASSAIDHMNLDDDPSEYDSTHESSIGGGVEAIYECDGDDLHRADQLALWIKNLADILHEEARKV